MDDFHKKGKKCIHLIIHMLEILNSLYLCLSRDDSSTPGIVRLKLGLQNICLVPLGHNAVSEQ